MDFPLGIFLPFIWDCCVWSRTHPVQQAPLCQVIGNPRGWRETPKKKSLSWSNSTKINLKKKQTSTVEVFYFLLKPYKNKDCCTNKCTSSVVLDGCFCYSAVTRAWRRWKPVGSIKKDSEPQKKWWNLAVILCAFPLPAMLTIVNKHLIACLPIHFTHFWQFHVLLQLFPQQPVPLQLHVIGLAPGLIRSPQTCPERWSRCLRPSEAQTPQEKNRGQWQRQSASLAESRHGAKMGFSKDPVGCW